MVRDVGRAGNAISSNKHNTVQILDSVHNFYRAGLFGIGGIGFDLDGDFQTAFGWMDSGLWPKGHKTRDKLRGQPGVEALRLPSHFFQ